MKFNIWRLLSIAVISFLAITVWYLREVNQTAQETNNLLKNEKTTIEKKLGELFIQITSLKSGLVAEKKEKDILLTKIDGYETEKKSLTAEVERLKVELATMQSGLEEKETEIEALKKKIDEYTVATSELKHMLSANSKKGEGGKGAIDLEPITVKSKEKNQKVKGKILSVNRQYDFVVINLGTKNGIEEGDTMLVFRAKKFLGRVIVEKVAEKISAARALYKSLRDDVKIGDKVSY